MARLRSFAGTDPKNVTINDLAIPDTMCSKKGGGGYECPGTMQCVKVDLSAKAEGFYGMFNHFGTSKRYASQPWPKTRSKEICGP